MDPVSLLGVISGSITVVATIGNTLKALNELRGKYTDADQSIRTFITQLTAIRVAINLIQEWGREDLVEAPNQPELVDQLETTIDGCREAMGALAEDVANVVRGTAAQRTMPFDARTRYLWNEGIMKEHQNRLQSQVMVLQFLVIAVQWSVHLTTLTS